MITKTKTQIRWIVADLSPDANRIIASTLGSDVDENQIDSFDCGEGEKHKGYYIPSYQTITYLKQLASRKGSGIKFSVFKQECERFIRVDFSAMKKLVRLSLCMDQQEWTKKKPENLKVL